MVKSLRSKIFRIIAFLKTRDNNVLRCKINGFCSFNGKERFGTNVNFNGCKVYGKGIVSFGDNFHSGKNLIFLTTNHNYNGEYIPYDNTYIHKNVNIGENVWIGLNVTILGGVNIGEGSIIQAGSVISSDIDKFSIVGGNPAKKFKTRNVEKYTKLKKECKFH